MSTRRRIGLLVAGALAAASMVLVGCQPEQAGPLATMPVPTSTPSPTATAPQETVQPVGEPVTVVGGLAAPWSMVRLESGSTLISERDSGVVKELTQDGALRDVAVIPGVVHDGEGGLMGLEFVSGEDARTSGDWLYAMFTADGDNRVVRFPLEGAPGGYALGAGEEIITGMIKAGNHNGGRIKLGPDGMLYVTIGDAGDSGQAQQLGNLNGKILRVELDGSVPDDNPFPGSQVWSYGHRNPQGIAWDANGQLWAAEFGQNTWDEFNLITPGANYGWPLIEGASEDTRFGNPVYQWSTSDASPSGLAHVRGTFFMAALGGERLWAIYPTSAGTTAVEYYTEQYGRIRDVTAGPDGTLWLLTNNTDGRGNPTEGDDRILQVQLAPVP
jgi:glucose/arabinose dehydrogenase